MNHWADYVIFSIFILISLGIGLYHALTGGKQRTTEEFLMADRKLKIIPTFLSTLMSYISAILIIGSTAEVYSYGVMAWPMYYLGFTIAILLAERICVPWMYPLKLTSVNKYFQLRYGDQELRTFAAAVGILNAVLYMGTAMLAPAVALETATGFPMVASIPIMAALSIIYTALGGMRAVIWTDVFQGIVMIFGLLGVIIKGIQKTGGINNVFDIVQQENRMEHWIRFDIDPRTRQTFWGYLFGWGTQWFCVFGLQQAAVQRYSALPTIRKARVTMLLIIPGILVTVTMTFLIGCIALAYYSIIQCDPLVSSRIKQPNEILALFVRDVLKDAHGFSGFFLATLYSGALSSVSSNLSGGAANLWEDIIKYRMPGISEYKASIINKLLVVLLGIASTGMAFLASAMGGPVSQVAMAFFGACGGPLTGLFMISGIQLFKWVRSRAVLFAGLTGLVINLWIATASGLVKGKYPTYPPISVDGCSPPVNVSYIPNNVTELTGINNWYKVSFLWYNPIGALVTIILGLGISAVMNLCSKSRVKADLREDTFINWKEVITCRCERTQPAEVSLKEIKNYDYTKVNKENTDVSRDPDDNSTDVL